MYVSFVCFCFRSPYLCRLLSFSSLSYIALSLSLSIDQSEIAVIVLCRMCRMNRNNNNNKSNIIACKSQH